LGLGVLMYWNAHRPTTMYRSPPGAGQNGRRRSRGSCWYACRNGHCPHEYAGQQIAGIAKHIRTAMPMAGTGAAALRAGQRANPVPADRGSSQETDAAAAQRLPRPRPVAKPRLRGVLRKVRGRRPARLNAKAKAKPKTTPKAKPKAKPQAGSGSSSSSSSSSSSTSPH
jgi:hypothetical protein